MIFYFTGTGNSQWAAGQLGKILHEPVYSIRQDTHSGKPALTHTISPDEKILFVFPVHSWGPPVSVSSFIKELVLEKYDRQPVYVVCTCGDDCGYTDRMIETTIRQQGWNFQRCYSVTMPNNYILFPGFDIDTPEITEKKLIEAGHTIRQIGEAIQQATALDKYTRGTIPFIKSNIIQPLFVRHVLGKNSFYATDACISCKLCEKICPTGTIRMEHRKPVWDNTCVQCLACIHRCPERAIEYGKISLKKGRYHHPDVNKLTIDHSK
ncbi:MAG: EFR1 family ferrodoxin [Tannerellaceae bacterium]|nr:EFR1 family ferrodoxin [Tannerellaceae bacterium]